MTAITASETKYYKMTIEEWEKAFLPINNFISEWASFNGRMFETYGVDYKVVDAVQNINRVWTVLETDGVLSIVEGQHMVNRFGYFITEVSYDSTVRYDITIDHDHTTGEQCD